MKTFDCRTRGWFYDEWEKKRVRKEGGREEGGGREGESVDLLLENILTGEPSLLIPGQPLNCQVGPATNTATTCFLRR